jgi:hypothetical protein
MTIHRLVDGKLYRLEGNVWVEVKPRVDLEQLDNPDPQENTVSILINHKNHFKNRPLYP